MSQRSVERFDPSTHRYLALLSHPYCYPTNPIDRWSRHVVIRCARTRARAHSFEPCFHLPLSLLTSPLSLVFRVRTHQHNSSSLAISLILSVCLSVSLSPTWPFDPNCPFEERSPLPRVTLPLVSLPPTVASTRVATCMLRA